MTRSLRWRDRLVAVRAAVVAPRAIARALPTLLALPGDPPRHGAPDARRVDDTLRLTRRALAMLSRVPGARWRTSCLYRSAAECLALRALGVPARVVIGVGTAPAGDAEAPGAATAIRAHAWVEGAAGTPPGAFAVLTGPALAGGHAAR